MKTLITTRLLIAIFFLVASTTISLAGEWRVMPIRLEFDQGAKSGAITVVNDGNEKINFQLKAFEWTQDSEGKDVYTETSEIVYMPKIMALDGKDERVIRAGIKFPAVAREKTYRLFIEEIPQPRKEQGTNVAIAIKFGVPIFVKPLKEEVKGEIVKAGLAKGTLTAIISNSGTVHFNIGSLIIRGKDATGAEVFSKQLKGWYLLSGSQRQYSTPIASDECTRSARLEIEVVTDKTSIKKILDVDKAGCQP